MNRIIALLVLMFSTHCIAVESPCYWQGTYAKCLPSGGLWLDNARALRLSPDTNSSHYIGISASSSLATAYNLILPDTAGSSGQSLRYSVAPDMEWYTPFSTSDFTAYKTSIPIKQYTYAASTANIASLSGDPGTIDGVDFSFGGFVTLKNQTTHSQNGLWSVDPLGAWSRMATMPDNTSSALAAISAVIPGGTVNGSTIWFSTADGGGDVSFIQIPTTNSNAPLTSALDVITTTGGRLTTNAITGTGNGVRASSPTLVTPTLGVASATSTAITGTAGAGYIDLTGETAPSTPAAGHVRLYATSTAQRLAVVGDSGNAGVLNMDGLGALRTFTFPDVTDTLAVKGANSFTAAQFIDGSVDAVQLTVQGHSTQTSDILLAEKSDGTDVLNVTNVNGTKIRGTTTNDAAAAGFVGEVLSSTFGSVNAGTSTTTVNTASLALTAGNWVIYASVSLKLILTTQLTGGSNTVVNLSATTASATPIIGDGYDKKYYYQIANLISTGAVPLNLTLGPVPLATTGQTVYLNTNTDWTVAAPQYYGAIVAVRVR